MWSESCFSIRNYRLRGRWAYQVLQLDEHSYVISVATAKFLLNFHLSIELEFVPYISVI